MRLLVVVAFMLFRPDFVMDRIQPPFESVAPTAFAQALDTATDGQQFRLVVSGPDFDSGETKETTLVLPIMGDADGATRLADTGLILFPEGDVVKMDEPSFSSPFSSNLSSFDFYADTPVQIARIQAPTTQMPKELVFIPALLLLLLIVMSQRGRMNKEGVPA